VDRPLHFLDGASPLFAAVSAVAAAWAVWTASRATIEQRTWRLADRRSRHFERTVLDRLRDPIDGYCIDVKSRVTAAHQKIETMKKANASFEEVRAANQLAVSEFDEGHLKFKSTINTVLSAWPYRAQLTKPVHLCLEDVQDQVAKSLQTLCSATPCLITDSEIEFLVSSVYRILLSHDFELDAPNKSFIGKVIAKWNSK
jgi:hypothetical protein